MCSNTSVCINPLYTGRFVFNENSDTFIPSKRTERCIHGKSCWDFTLMFKNCNLSLKHGNTLSASEMFHHNDHQHCRDHQRHNGHLCHHDRLCHYDHPIHHRQSPHNRFQSSHNHCQSHHHHQVNQEIAVIAWNNLKPV